MVSLRLVLRLGALKGVGQALTRMIGLFERMFVLSSAELLVVGVVQSGMAVAEEVGSGRGIQCTGAVVREFESSAAGPALGSQYIVAVWELRRTLLAEARSHLVAAADLAVVKSSAHIEEGLGERCSLPDMSLS